MTRYTIRSVETGELFTFDTKEEDLATELKFLAKLPGFALDGIDGENGYLSPAPRPFFAHSLDEEEGI